MLCFIKDVYISIKLIIVGASFPYEEDTVLIASSSISDLVTSAASLSAYFLSIKINSAKNIFKNNYKLMFYYILHTSK